MKERGLRRTGRCRLLEGQVSTCPYGCSAVAEERVRRGDGAAPTWVCGQGRGVAGDGTGAPSQELVGVTSHRHPHHLRLPREPPERGWEVPRLHAPCGCRGAVLPAALCVLSPGPSLEVRSLSGLSRQKAEARGWQKLPAPPKAFGRIQCVLSTHVPWARGWHVAKASLTLEYIFFTQE